MQASFIEVEHKQARKLQAVRLEEIGAVDLPETEIATLMGSLDRLGQLQPVVLEALSAPEAADRGLPDGTRYVVIDGRHRVAAARKLAWARIDAVVREAGKTSEPEAAAMTLSANAVKRGNPLAELHAIETLLAHGMDEKGIAKQMGVSVEWVRQRTALKALNGTLRETLAAGHMTFSTARQVATLSAEDQRLLVRTALDREMAKRAEHPNASMTVSQADVETIRQTEPVGLDALFAHSVTPAVDPRQAPGDHGYAAPKPGDPCVYCGGGVEAAAHGSLNDDENVKAMRETARAIGLTQVLLDISRSPAAVGCEDIERLGRALELLGVTDEEVGA